jgi:hypothetical protein
VLWLVCCCDSEQMASDEDSWNRRGMRRRESAREREVECSGVDALMDRCGSSRSERWEWTTARRQSLLLLRALPATEKLISLH